MLTMRSFRQNPNVVNTILLMNSCKRAPSDCWLLTLRPSNCLGF